MKSKTKAICVKVSAEDYRKIKAKADKHTHGNVSEWLRWAGISHVLTQKKPVKDPDDFY